MGVDAKEQSFLDPSIILDHLGVQPGMWVGDFGVGAGGHFVTPIATAVGTDGGVIMFDVLRSALSGAMSRAKLSGVGNYRAVWTNLEVYEGAPGVSDNALDAGILINVLHQSTAAKDMLAEIHRMLKPGARLLIADWKKEIQSPIAPPIERRLADGYVERLAQEVGFALLERFSFGPYYWGLVLVKNS